MEALLYLFTAIVFIAAGAALWNIYGPSVTSEVTKVKAAADRVRQDVGKL